MAPRLIARPWTVTAARKWVSETHRRLPKVQGGLWAVRVERGGEVVGCALVGHAARLLMQRDVLAVIRVAVLEGEPNACSKLYGACAKAAKSMGARGLVTYTHADEPGTSLRAAGWVYGGMTGGGEWSREGRERQPALFPDRKLRWWAPWSEDAKKAAA